MTSTLPIGRPAASITTTPSFGKPPSIVVPSPVIVGSVDASMTRVTIGEKTIVLNVPILASLMAQRSVSKPGKQSVKLLSSLRVTVRVALACGSVTCDTVGENGIGLNVPGALTTVMAQRSVGSWPAQEAVL